jgi:hypothetical protein
VHHVFLDLLLGRLVGHLGFSFLLHGWHVFPFLLGVSGDVAGGWPLLC